MEPKDAAENRTTPDESAAGDEQEKKPAAEGSARPETPRFPIAGVGASAGGLEAFTELLKHLPMDTGIGFVVVQHLAPTHHSMLTELLARATRLPVTEVTDGMVVEANHVYVIPPNTDMAILSGALRLMPRPPVSGPPLPIDSFFTSLAADRGSKAIGIILSGSASDGTLGLKAIKANGGFTFAQNESAKYESMPRSAIAAGYVDFVLPPEGIAKELARIGRHPYVAPVKPERVVPKSEPVAEDHLAKAFVWLRSATGVDFNHYKRATIVRRIRRRMVLHNMESLSDYIRYLQGNRGELEALYHDILINVTSFFREPEGFETLKKEVFPQLMVNRPPEARLRIWVPACSTGEEAYSIAICATEFLREIKSGAGLQIFATDISEGALEKARLGRYTPSDVSGVDADRLRQFFVSTEDGYQIIKSIREACIFAKQNVTKDAPFSRLDLISCRNLLIYLDATAQKKLMQTFHYALRSGGFLVLGRSEGIGEFTEFFDLVDKKHRVYAKKDRQPQAYAAFDVDDLGPEKPAETAPSGAAARELNLQKEINRVLLTDYTPPGVVVDKDLQIVQFHGHAGPYLDPAPGAANLRLLQMAHEGLALDLRTAIHQAQEEGRTVLRKRVRIGSGGEERQIAIEVRPLKLGATGTTYFLVLFREPVRENPPLKATSKKKSDDNRQVLELTQQLDQTKAQLQQMLEEFEARNEELHAANEEIASSNEELQSTNEELETAKEELQAANEELTTLNEELHNRNVALATSNNDLSNVISSVSVPIIIVGADLRIRWFTPAAAKALNLITADVGRPITDLRSALDFPELESMVVEAVEVMGTQEREVVDRQGRWQSLRVRPYKTSENRIEGAVLTLVDITEPKTEATEARSYAEAIVDTVRESILVLDKELRVKAANSAFWETFRVSREETEGRRLPELGEGQWNIPQLLELLNDVLLRQNEVRDFEVEHEFPAIGSRTMQLNARLIQRHSEAGSLILLVIEDVTERRRTHKVQEEQSQLIELAHDAIMVRDRRGAVTSWNQGAETLYGWTKDEALGKVTHRLLQTAFPESREDLERQLMTQGEWSGELVHTTRTGDQVIVFSRQVVKRDPQGEPEAILEINRDITAHRRADTSLRSSEERFRLLVANVKDYAIFALDPEGRVESWNRGAGRIKGYTAEEIVGKHFSIFYPPEDVRAGKPDWMLKTAIAEGRVEEEGWRVRKDGSRFWANVVMTPRWDSSGVLRGFTKVTRDITERMQAHEALKKTNEELRSEVAERMATEEKLRASEQSLRQLSGQLIRAQDEERRRVARELHDGTAQSLSALSMYLARVDQSGSGLDANAQQALSECVSLVEQCSREVRTLSYLMHPPGLDEAGLAPALRWFVEGFIDRSGITVEVDISSDWPRLVRDAEVAIFRIAQECLANVHRHSGSSRATVRLARGKNEVVLEVKDSGRGTPPEVIKDLQKTGAGLGVGLRGMHERLLKFGGSLMIESSSDVGTTVRAVLPLSRVIDETQESSGRARRTALKHESK
jgi:two-component system, chemotaxis family, CheB/CheR fusion protein